MATREQAKRVRAKPEQVHEVVVLPEALGIAGVTGRVRIRRVKPSERWTHYVRLHLARDEAVIYERVQPMETK